MSRDDRYLMSFHWAVRGLGIFVSVSVVTGALMFSSGSFTIAATTKGSTPAVLPNISSIDPPSGAPGMTLKIYGTGLNPPKAFMRPKVVFGSNTITTIIKISDSLIEVVVPPNGGSKGSVDLYVDTVKGPSKKVKFTYLAPFISEVRPRLEGPKQAVITLVGKNFGTRQPLSTSNVKFGKSMVFGTGIVSWKDTQIVFNTPSDFGTGINQKIVMGLIGCVSTISGVLAIIKGELTLAQFIAEEFIVNLAIPSCDTTLVENLVKKFDLVMGWDKIEGSVPVQVITGAGASNEKTYTYQIGLVHTPSTPTPSPSQQSQSLSIDLSADKYSGTTSLNSVSLTATVTGSAKGTINYTFYCDRSDSGTNITSGWYEKFDGVFDNPKTATCSYPNPGTYTAKVIVERGTVQAEARATVKIDSPVVDSLKLAPTISVLGCSPTPLMIGQSVNCNPSFSGNVSSYSWSAPGGSTASGSGLTFSTRFDSIGTKTITLRACNGSACTLRAQDVLVMPLTPLPAPTLTSPNGVTGVATTPTFSWSAVSGANRYWLMVATSSAAFPTDPNATSCPLCVSTGVSGNTHLTSHTLPNAFPNGGTTGTLSANTVYYWKVQAWNNATSPTTQGQYSATGSFTTAAAPAPTISYVSPNPVVSTGVAQPFTINGNNFASGATVTLRTPAGDVYPNRTISSLSATQIVINQNFGTVADTWTVEVISLGGVSSGRFAFTVTTPMVPAPTISYLSPNPVTGLDGAQTITIVGSNFVNKPTLTLTWSGQSNYTVPAAQVTYVNSTQLQMSINTTTFADNWTVKVTNPDGKLSNTVGFVVSVHKSDLVVEGLSPSPSSGLAGTNATVSFTVRNQGAGPALPSTANLRINSSYSSVTTGEYLLASVSVPRIEAGMSYSVNQSVTIPSSQSTGTNYVWVILDVNSTANQSDGNNDKANAPFTVNAACSGVFCVNDVVTVYGTGGIGLRLRQCARTEESLCPKITTMPDGTQMIVFGGPAYGDGYTWWAISGYVSGIYRTGWAVQDYLRK